MPTLTPKKPKTIRIRPSKTVHSKGQLFLYRSDYVPATKAVSGERIPGHMRESYIAAVPRFVDADVALDKINYVQGIAVLNDVETKTLRAYIATDKDGYKKTWDAGLVADIRAQIRDELEHEQFLSRATTEQSDFDICATVLAGAARDVVSLAATFKADNQVLADGWLREKDQTDAPGENALTQLKARANAIRKAYKEVFEPALKQAGLVQDKAAAAAAAAAKAAEGGAQ